MNLSGLTTPSVVDWKMKPFLKKLSAKQTVFIDVQPEAWSRQCSCDMNVKKLVELIGGSAVVGYKIWYLRNQYIEAERHVVHEKDGIYRDPTFNLDGEMRILFVPDPETSTGYDDRPLKLREGLTEKAVRFCQERDAFERNDLRPRMSSEESWERMPSYEDWLAGVRVPNAIQAFV